MNSPPAPLPTENLIAYGLGGAFHWFHEIFMVRKGLRPAYLADRSCKDGEFRDGIPVCRDIGSRIPASERGRYCIVVCTGTEETFNSIREPLSAQGFEKIVWIHQLYEVHDPFDLSEDDFSSRGAGQREHDIAAARALLDDDQSRKVFDCFVETHRTKIPVVIPRSPPDEQYFPQDFGAEMPLHRMVLCGADTHDLIRLSRKIDSPIESLFVFEADPYLFKRISNDRFLSDRIGQLNRLARSFVLSPCAVSSATSVRPFSSLSHPSIPDGQRTTFGSRLHENGSDMVQAIALDHVIRGIEPSYICMDIEGEELMAVSGARRILESSATNFAISVYHKASHIWEIPLLIHSINRDYKFHLRNYTGFCSETVLYATV